MNSLDDVSFGVTVHQHRKLQELVQRLPPILPGAPMLLDEVIAQLQRFVDVAQQPAERSPVAALFDERFAKLLEMAFFKNTPDLKTREACRAAAQLTVELIAAVVNGTSPDWDVQETIEAQIQCYHPTGRVGKVIPFRYSSSLELHKVMDAAKQREAAAGWSSMAVVMHDSPDWVAIASEP